MLKHPPIRLAAERIPESLRKRDQWVCWRCVSTRGDVAGRTKKIPLSPRTLRYAKVNSPVTWASFEEASKVYEKNVGQVAGIGFVFTDRDPFVGVDLDHCRQTSGLLDPWAEEVVANLATYTEVSPSGTGVKAIATTHAKVRSRKRSSPGIEIYPSNRFFALTGVAISRSSETVDCTEQLNWLEKRYFPAMPSLEQARPGLVIGRAGASDGAVLAKARNANNGAKFCQLWEGSTATNDGDHSQADLSLCRILAFWCGPCPEQIDRLFRLSGLFRAKWDERHFSNGMTYGAETVVRAIAGQHAYYSWNNY